MTDNRTTELLPCPFCGGEAHTFKNNWWHVSCERARCGCVVMSAFNAEAEAIEAWNTRADYHGYEKAAIEAWKSIKEWNTRATGGTLTADDVRDLIERHSDAAGGNRRDFHNGAYEAIADELNTRAERTCKVIASYDTADVDRRGSNAEWYFAFSCGCELYWDEPEPPNYCPNCGAKVVGE